MSRRTHCIGGHAASFRPRATPMISCPCDARRAATADPINPAPPTIRTLMFHCSRSIAGHPPERNNLSGQTFVPAESTMNASRERTRSIWMDTEVFPQAARLEQDVTADTVVVGSGIAGLSTAYELALQGQKV